MREREVECVREKKREAEQRKYEHESNLAIRIACFVLMTRISENIVMKNELWSGLT